MKDTIARLKAFLRCQLERWTAHRALDAEGNIVGVVETQERAWKGIEGMEVLDMPAIETTTSSDLADRIRKK